MEICYIVGAGSFTNPFVPDGNDFVIAADGGYDHLIRHGIRCDLLIGDLDSISNVPHDVEILRHPVEKDETDMHLAYLEGVRRGYVEFRIYGGTGGREDHTFANLSLLLYMRNRGHQGSVYSDTGAYQVIKNEKITVFGETGCHLSAFAFGGEARGVTIQGLEYGCTDITLTPEFPLAVSNRFVGTRGEVSVRDGTLLVMTEIR